MTGVPKIAVAVLAVLLVVVVLTYFPSAKQTLIEIIRAFKGA